MAQTTIQNQDAIRTGSAKIEISANGTVWKDLGALRKIIVKELGKTDVIKFDNVQEIKKFSDGDKFSIAFDMAEINWQVLEMMKDGQVNATTNAGVDTRVVFASGGKLIGKFVRLTNTNSAGEDLTINMINCSMTSAIEFPFIADDEADVMTIPVVLEGYMAPVDAIVDEQLS